MPGSRYPDGEKTMIFVIVIAVLVLIALMWLFIAGATRNKYDRGISDEEQMKACNRMHEERMKKRK